MTRTRSLLPLAVVAIVAASGCGSGGGSSAAATNASSASASQTASYFDNTGRDDTLSGGVKMITITTPKGKYHVWTKRIGNNPKIKVLLLHGGPGATHEYLEGFDSYFPGAGVEYYYYDQLGSAYSDQPDQPTLWTIPRFVDEVEQVRQALKLDKDNFYLLGQSWGGILAMEYALAHQDHLKGLIISNMMASIPAYNDYAHRVLMPAMNQDTLKQILAIEAAKKYEDPRYDSLLMTSFYTQHLLRMPADQWPDPVLRAFAKINRKIYVPMQGPSEMGASGTLEHWDRFNDLKNITVPTLVIGAKYDTMDPAYMEKMSKQIPNGRYLFCPTGSHLALYDDQQTYTTGVIKFLKDVDAGK